MPDSSAWTIRRVLLLAGRVSLGLIFIYAAYTKLSQPWPLLAMAIEAYKVLPDSMRDLLARSLPWFELALGLLLISGYWLRTAATVSAALLGGFFSIMAYAYLTHPEGSGINCGCFGFGEAISRVTLARDGLLLAMAIAVAVGAFRMRKPNPNGGDGFAAAAREQRAA